MDNAIPRRASCWSQMSLINLDEKNYTINNKITMHRQMSEANSHHTFFPRSETSSKIDEYSNSHIDLDSEFKLF